MLPTFDIFKTDAKAALVWCGASETFQEAECKVQSFADSEGEFVMFNQQT